MKEYYLTVRGVYTHIYRFEHDLGERRPKEDYMEITKMSNWKETKINFRVIIDSAENIYYILVSKTLMLDNLSSHDILDLF